MAKKFIIPHSEILARLRESGLRVSHENVRYYREKRDVPKKRNKKSKYADPIERAEAELIKELKLRIDGTNKRQGRKSPNEPAAVSP